MQRKFSLIVLTCILWCFAVAFGLTSLEKYSQKAGLQPQHVLAQLPVNQSTLIVFLHPKCSCSRATMEELDSALAQMQSKPRLVIKFIRPSGWTDDDVKSKLWTRANLIPDSVVEIDADGSEAKRFGVKTSGHILAYDSQGQLKFSGGITKSRGHEGDNAGKQALISFINFGTPSQTQSRVFGCSLFKHHNERSS